MLRRAIQAANEEAAISHAGTSRSIADWLAWKREVLQARMAFLGQCRERIRAARRTGMGVVVHLDEKALNEEIELLEEVSGWLAGQLNLKNATMTVDVPEADWRTGLEGRVEELLARPAASAGPCTVVLEGLLGPGKKISVIKVVRELVGCGLAEGKALVENTPSVVRANVPRDEAETMRRKLEEAGGRVSFG